jgi:hypothetical protein
MPFIVVLLLLVLKDFLFFSKFYLFQTLEPKFTGLFDLRLYISKSTHMPKIQYSKYCIISTAGSLIQKINKFMTMDDI